MVETILLTAWVEAGLVETMFEDAPAGDETWIGGLFIIDQAREVLPFRFAGLSYLIMFLSPYAEGDDDEEFILQQLDTLCIHNFMPVRNSRLIKFCRADADKDHFKPTCWVLPHATHIFQFLQTMGDAVKLYLQSVPHIEQYLFLPANARLSRLYSRLSARISTEMGIAVTATLPATGALHAYQRA